MPGWKLGEAENIRNKLTKEQENEISKLYRDVYLQTRKQLQAIPKDGTVSQQLQRQYLNKLIKQLNEAYKSLGTELEKEVKKQAKKAAQGVVDDINSTMSRAGLSMEGAYSYVAKDVVESIATGQVYGGKWSLSGAIWSDIDKHQSDINRIVAAGTAANLSSYEIAQSLEQYVDPKAKKPWDWSKVYPGTSKKVDYNAQRLARTMVSHAYQQSLERVCKNNPFVDGYIWQSAHSNRVCPICAARDGEFFKKGELPLDHPNGMCTFIANIPDSMEEVADRLADWVSGKEDPEIDKWMKELSPELKDYAQTKNNPVPKKESQPYNYKQAIQSYDPSILGREEGHPIGYDRERGIKLGVTQEQYNKNIEKWNKYIQKQMEKGEPSMQVNQNTLAGILQSGQFKNVYQTGLSEWQKGSQDYLKYRTETERSLFGITDPSKGAPIYGYMNTGKQIREEYGDIRIVFDRSVMDKATFTVGDSMESRTQPFTNGQTLTEKNLLWNQPYDSTTNTKTMNRYAEYIEMQYHGTLKTESIKEIVLPKKHDKALEEAIEKAGIAWRVGK